jgi:hypothetical protein
VKIKLSVRACMCTHLYYVAFNLIYVPCPSNEMYGIVIKYYSIHVPRLNFLFFKKKVSLTYYVGPIILTESKNSADCMARFYLSSTCRRGIKVLLRHLQRPPHSDNSSNSQGFRGAVEAEFAAKLRTLRISLRLLYFTKLK